MNKSWILIGYAFLICGAQAQEAYRCTIKGAMVIQDTPCKPSGPSHPLTGGGKTKEVSATSSISGKGPIESGKQLCTDHAVDYVTWKDKDSLRIEKAFGGKMTVVDTGVVRTSGRQFFIEVNGKNSYGGYTGNKTLICYTSEDGSRIIHVDTILL